ncbi:MAG: hypothetical protein CMP71_01495 [Flavobacteriales bacterium]|nr:hypothetical protein [Flavobacteriales bacterium]|tara:strand:+ start:30788 stop:31942 length:1155 start_codon:yes stop_codon:yes gene_type:complete
MKNKNIGFFSNQFTTNQGHGIARYSKYLYSHLKELKSNYNFIPIATGSEKKSRELRLLKDNSGLRILPFGRKITPLLWKYLNFPKIENMIDCNINLLHAHSLTYPIATNKPYIVTIHDIGPLTHPQFFTKKDNWLMKESFRQIVKKADHLICVSKYTATEVELFCKKNYHQSIEKRISVVYEGVGKFFFNKIKLNQIADNDKIKFLKEKKFILCVGKLSPRKNFSSVIKAFNLIKNSFDHHLIAVGGDGWDFKKSKQYINSLKLQNRVHMIGFVSDELLRYLYTKASVFVYPSLFEGFGLTILEAMACQCPVITSNKSSLPEIAGRCATIIDPMDIYQLSESIISVCRDNSEIKSQKSSGLKRAKSLNWNKTAKETHILYEKYV